MPVRDPGTVGSRESSFLRAGLLHSSTDTRFLPLPIVRPERAVLTGERGLAHAIHRLRADLGLPQPIPGGVKTACQPNPSGAVAGAGWRRPGR